MFQLLLRRLPPPPPTSVCVQRNVLSHLMKLQVNSQHTPVFFFKCCSFHFGHYDNRFFWEIVKYLVTFFLLQAIYPSPGFNSLFGKIVIFISIIYEFKRKFVRNDFTPLYNFLHFLRTGNFSHFIITKNIAFN